MKNNRSLISIDDLENYNEDIDFVDDIMENINDDFEEDEFDQEIEDVTDEFEIIKSNDDIDNSEVEDEDEFDIKPNKNSKGIKKKRKDNIFYSTKIKIKDHLDERLYPKSNIAKKITNLDTYERIYDGVENTIKVTGNFTGKSIKKCTKITKNTIKFLSVKQKSLSENLKTKMEGEVEVKVKSIQTAKGEKTLVDITIRKYWNERCIKNLDEKKVDSLIERIKLNKDEPYILVKLKSGNVIKEIKIEKWSYDEIIHKLNYL